MPNIVTKQNLCQSGLNSNFMLYVEQIMFNLVAVMTKSTIREDSQKLAKESVLLAISDPGPQDYNLVLEVLRRSVEDHKWISATVEAQSIGESGYDKRTVEALRYLTPWTQGISLDTCSHRNPLYYQILVISNSITELKCIENYMADQRGA
jgi:hypothetical protein